MFDEMKDDGALDDVLADAADELRSEHMFSLAAGVEKARRVLGEVMREPQSAVRLANTELANEGFAQLGLRGVL
jgi:hypothetical protein